MASSASSSALQARQQVAARLREIRHNAGLSRRAIAESAGWDESSASRIEAAQTRPTESDIRAWCHACGADDQAADLIAISHAALRRVPHTVPHQVPRTASRTLELPGAHGRRSGAGPGGLRRAHGSPVRLWEATRTFRIYSPCLIPSPLQSQSYNRALLTAARDSQPTSAGDIEDAVSVRVAHGRLIHQPGHEFTVIIEESVLRHRIGGTGTLREQLQHLGVTMALPSVRLGIIPFTADRTPLYPVEMFFIFDDAEVQAELVFGLVRVARPADIEMYAEAFARLSQMAVYGREAWTLITRALSELS
jgi:transcriptional regulator with XRE-family HTH domain